MTRACLPLAVLLRKAMPADVLLIKTKNNKQWQILDEQTLHACRSFITCKIYPPARRCANFLSKMNGFAGVLAGLASPSLLIGIGIGIGYWLAGIWSAFG